MLFMDVSRSFEGCYVLIPSKDKCWGQITGVSSENYGMEDEVDEHADDIIYHVETNQGGGRYRADQFAFLHAPLKYGWAEINQGSAVHVSINSRRQWKKGVTRHRLSGAVPQFGVGEGGEFNAVALSRRTMEVLHNTGAILHDTLMAPALTVDQVMEKFNSTLPRRIRTPYRTHKMNTDIALSGFYKGSTFLVWHGLAAVATYDSRSGVVSLPNSHQDYYEVLSDNFEAVELEDR